MVWSLLHNGDVLHSNTMQHDVMALTWGPYVVCLHFYLVARGREVIKAHDEVRMTLK